GLVIHGTRTDRIHVAPIAFFLGMLQRIAVALGGGRNQILGPVFFRDLERMKRAQRSNFQGSNAVGHVIYRAGGAGKVKDIIHFAAIKGLTNVELPELKAAVILQVLQVPHRSGEQVVDGDDGIALAKQSVAKVGGKKSGPAGNQRAFFTHTYLRLPAEGLAAADSFSLTAGARPTL